MSLRILFVAFFALVLTGCHESGEAPTPVADPVAATVAVPVASESSESTDADADVDAEADSDSPVRKFTITASQWKFVPDVIEVNEGETVRLTLTNIDVSHGISIPAFGVDLTAVAGDTKTTEFVASKTGEFPFFCNVFCGTGHGDMIGTLIVK